MTLTDLIGDTAAIGRMSDAEFSEYWTALGTVVRIACRARIPAPPAPEPEQQRTEINNTSGSAERAWSPHRRAPAAAFGFSRCEPGEQP